MVYLANTMHILPNSKIPVEKVPLDIFISNKRAFIAKEGEEFLTDNQTLTVDEYDFPHSVCILTAGVSASALELAFKACLKHLGDKVDQTSGLMILTSPKWLFVAPITGPYSVYQMMPMYLDGYSYAGIVSFQEVVPEWPSTAGLTSSEHTVLGALAQQAREWDGIEDIITSFA